MLHGSLVMLLKFRNYVRINQEFASVPRSFAVCKILHLKISGVSFCWLLPEGGYFQPNNKTMHESYQIFDSILFAGNRVMGTVIGHLRQ